MASAEGNRKAATVRQILELLTTTRLLPSDEISALRAEWSGSKLDSDGGELARRLVQSGKLTKYQAAAVYQNQAKAVAVGDYILLERIGGGGVGSVYKARKHDGRQLVALKVLNAASARSADAVKRFRREAEAAVRLNHPEIARAIEAGEAAGRLFLVMELLEGVDLSAYLRKQGPLPVEQAVECILAAARGLAYAHAQGIVHRDIKPGNLFLTRGREVKVLDLGLARLSDVPAEGDDLTRTGQVMGTVDFMAPEQALNTRLADKRADVYSLGCTFYRLVTGENPYGGESLVEKVLAHREHPIPSLRHKNRSVKSATDAVLRRMLAKNPDDRYQTMDEVADALRQSLEDSSVEQFGAATLGEGELPTSVPQPPRAAPIAQAMPPNLMAVPVDVGPARRIPVVVYVVAVLILLAVGTVALRLFVRDPPSESEPQSLDSVALATGNQEAPVSPASVMSPTSTGTPPGGMIVSNETPPAVGTPSATITPPSPTAGPAPSSAASPSPTSAGGAVAAIPTQPSRPTAPSGTAVSGATGTAAPSPAAGGSMPAGAVPSATARPAPQPSATATATAPAATGTKAGAQSGARKHAVPDAAALDAAIKLIRGELYKEAYGQLSGGPETAQLAATLLQRAASLAGDPVGRYALLSEARDVALQAADMGQADEAARAAATEYEINRHAWLADGIEAVVDHMIAGPVVRQLAGECWNKLEEAVAEGRPEQAEQLAKSAAAAARKSQDPALLHLYTEREKKIGKDHAAREAAYRMRDRLQAKPDDPPANHAWGRYLCYVLNDWELGLAHLAKGNDPLLKELAQKGVPPPADADGRIKLGDQWWARADRVNGIVLKNELRISAAYWYRQGMKGARAPERMRVEKRIAEADLAVEAAASPDPTAPIYLRLPTSEFAPLYLRLIRPGTFLMGSPTTENPREADETQHPVLLTKPFYLGVTEVTHEQWKALGGRMPLQYPSGPRVPITNISQNTLDSFFQTINRGPYGAFLRFRLPTEAEWEYAARAGTTTTYYWGDDLASAPIYCVAGNPNSLPQAVGGRRPNAWGLYDMMGNCWEPCSDFRSPGIPYEPRFAIDPIGPPRSTQTTLYAMRGGCCVSTITTLRTAFRGTHGASSSDKTHGIRFACDIAGNIPPVLIASEPPAFTLTAEANQAILNSR